MAKDEDSRQLSQLADEKRKQRRQLVTPDESVRREAEGGQVIDRFEALKRSLKRPVAANS